MTAKFLVESRLAPRAYLPASLSWSLGLCALPDHPMLHAMFSLSISVWAGGGTRQDLSTEVNNIPKKTLLYLKLCVALQMLFHHRLS